MNTVQLFDQMLNQFKKEVAFDLASITTAVQKVVNYHAKKITDHEERIKKLEELANPKKELPPKQ